ncbi:M23 family metallopeptidase [Paenibacillus mucilaginosus]|uniref:M23B subfamily peptidase n=2 Tax=Paenibacillus mucilaginosus TaxID=61624 RepID=H6N9F7_9BACL|nr:M23 family metallopeptidase [Paenibacillus mucilaginosus]AEI42160.1 M23B subfamily peptidase [Paenibacillus mucilaginosus KNP414]AFC27963.1 M23B subfamily peptidase [Paenibacillus mucilaginosus 3016]MCG7214134.1 M23 family metallopeptidase [Paenibacillus mucilaginosus]WDM28654.1 M23 family metallopeptidase [Paenibacillus mucilaginosus]WFA16818.1 M23 family metallopeptidase [Paenibacillus mucilaginosus]
MTAIHTRACAAVLTGTLLLGLVLGAENAWAGAPAKAPSAAKPEAGGGMKAMFAERRDLFDKVSTLTGIPWYYLAAVDQYERTLNLAKKRPAPDGRIAIHYTDLQWGGVMNPDHEDKNPESIRFFGGRGRDGDGDGLADRTSDIDRLFSMASYLQQQGTAEDDLRIGLWEYYQNSRSVDRITQFARIYAAFDTLELHEHCFVMPLGADYSYRSTWGASRGWGGYRIHEGTDIFAGHGVPVRSATYGIVEIMGWNPYGGWRIGIRDLNNVYHYYAHLSGFNKKEVKPGEIVKPGQVIGWVGSSGYGKPGTSGKFPPHLHYGLYRDNGLSDWSFDPYPHLRKWEREERLRRRK